MKQEEELKQLRDSLFRHVGDQWDSLTKFQADRRVTGYIASSNRSGSFVNSLWKYWAELNPVRREVNRLTLKTLNHFTMILFGQGSLAALGERRRQDESGFKEAALRVGAGEIYTLTPGECLRAYTQKGTPFRCVVEGPVQNSKAGNSYRATIIPPVPHELSHSQLQVFIKTVAVPISRDSAAVTKGVQTFQDAYLREKGTLERLTHVVGRVAHIRGSGSVPIHDSDGKYIISGEFLVEDLLSGQSLTEITKPDIGNGTVFAKWVIDIAKDLLSVLSEVHGAGVRHGDITAGNCMICSGRLYLVDFGESILMAPDVRGTASNSQMHGTPPERARNPHLPMDIAQDLWAAGATLFWVLTEKPVPTTLNAAEFKAEVRAAIPKSVREADRSIVHVICELLHPDAAERASSAEEVLRTISLFETIRVEPGQRAPTRLAKSNADLGVQLAALEKPENYPPVLRELVAAELAELSRRVNDITRMHRAEISGTRGEIIAGLLTYLSALRESDRYLTVTRPDFWREENLGLSGRFLTANQMLAERGVTVIRVLVVEKDQWQELTKPTQDVLLAQAKVVKELEAGGRVRTDESAIDQGGYFVGVLTPERMRGKSAFPDGYHVALMTEKEMNSGLTLSFEFDRKGEIHRLYIWEINDEKFIAEKIGEVREKLKQSRAILKFIPPEAFAAGREQPDTAGAGQTRLSEY